MLRRSVRTPTAVERTQLYQAEIYTMRDFLTFIQARDVRRVELKHRLKYRSEILSEGGSQFTVYTDAGIYRQGTAASVVKCAKLKLATTPALPDKKQQEIRVLFEDTTPCYGKVVLAPSAKQHLAASLVREIMVLTHPRLRNHPNIVQLFWYDLVEESDLLFTPALVIELASHGSLSAVLEARGSQLSQEASFIHGDVKADNFLVFPSSDGHNEFTVKISDFGSVILLKSAGDRHLRYYGTPRMNAPEVDEQSARLKPDEDALKRCDNYSLGLLIFEIAVQALTGELTKKDRTVLQFALSGLAATGWRETPVMSRILTLLLAYDPAERCSDLSVVKNMLQPVRLESFSLASLELSTNDGHNCMEERDLDESMKAIFGHQHYLEFNLDEEVETERETQAIVFEGLLSDSKSTDRIVAGKGFFQLAIAHSIGYGTPSSISAMLDAAVQSAKRGYLPAQAVVCTWYDATGQNMPVDRETQIDWLFECTAWGSFTAGAFLHRLDPEQYAEARTHFHKSGGFNQYFYANQPPDFIHSKEFAGSLDKSFYQDKRGELQAMAEAAAIYGDATLMKTLIQSLDVDPMLQTRWGETLLVLCCKGGHLDVLKILADAGVTASQHDSAGSLIRESPLHWLIAFEKEEKTEAAAVLSAICEEPDRAVISWNHPCIDLSGRFPLDSPLHYAAYFNDPDCVTAFTDILKIPVNRKEISEMTPVEFAVSRQRVDAAQALIMRGALDDSSENTLVLSELGVRLAHENLATAGWLQKDQATLVSECMDLVLAKRPELLDGGAEGGATPLIGAVMYHHRDMVIALIKRGCNVNMITAPEYEGKPALHYITFHRLQYPEDDILDLLYNAGADLDLRSLTGGKNVLHLTARDDCVPIAARLLELGVSVNSTTTQFGETALHVAAFYGSYNMAEFLLDHGADLEIGITDGEIYDVNWDNLTALAFAACTQRKRMVELLLRRGASVRVRPVTNHTIIHLAVADPGLDRLRMLLEIPELSTSDVLNATAANGLTALHLCVGTAYRHEQTTLLLEYGADIGILTPTGHSVLDIACQTRDLIEKWLNGDLPQGSVEERETEATLLWLPAVLRHGKIQAQDTGSNLNADENEDLRGSHEVAGGEHLFVAQAREESDAPRFDLDSEHHRWNDTIELLREKGARHHCSDPFPRSLFTILSVDATAVQA